MNNIAQEEHILALYMRYLQLKANRRTCPMVVGADLEYSLRTLRCGTNTEREFWISGAFMWDMKRLQLGEEWEWLATEFREGF
jgi:hypothetical protein